MACWILLKLLTDSLSQSMVADNRKRVVFWCSHSGAVNDTVCVRFTNYVGNATMMTRETDYALRTALCLAKSEANDAVVSTLVLAEKMSIPYRFLRKIVSKLVNAGLLESRRGKGGGLVLSRAASEISLLDIIQAVDPVSVLMNRCLEGGDGCERAPLCGVHQSLDEMQQELNAKLRSVSLAAVASRDQVVC